jgi:hypothetical protein
MAAYSKVIFVSWQQTMKSVTMTQKEIRICKQRAGVGLFFRAPKAACCFVFQ